jgi:sec-independent protein translocase protein TatA
MHLGFGEMVVVAVLAMLLFGPKRVSDLGVALGQSLRGFKKGLAGEEEVKPTGTAAVAAAPQQNGQPPTPPSA